MTLDRARQAGGAPATQAVIAAWDTTAGYGATGIGDTVVDTGPHGLHGEGVNRPVRGMTGFNWSGHEDCFRHAPAQFGGIEFHEDALADCGWQPTISMEVPEVKSGVYAARLRAGDAEEHVVFFLRPKQPTAPIAMLMPTCSYLAYANERIGLDTGIAQVLSSQVTTIHEWDLELRGSTPSTAPPATTATATARASATPPGSGPSSTCGPGTAWRPRSCPGSSRPTSRSSAGSRPWATTTT